MDVSIRLANSCFFEKFYEIKSEKHNIYWSGHSKKPDRNKLKLWFDKQLANEKREIFEVLAKGKQVGYLYVDELTSKVELSYAIKVSESGKGIATAVVASAVNYIKGKKGRGCAIVANVAMNNFASRRVLERNLFIPTGLTTLHDFELINERVKMIEYMRKDSKCLIIAEAGVNHNGSFEIAKKLVDAASYAGADAVKFQTWKTELLVTDNAMQADYQGENTGVVESQYEMLKKLELSYEEFAALKKYCDSKNIIFLSTPDEIESADFLKSLQDTFKIGSGELTNIPFLEHVGGFNKDVIISTGMGTLGEIENALSALIRAGTDKKSITVLHATTMYPTPMKDVNLNAMLTIRKAFNVEVGYSDHTLGVEVAVAAVAMGARVIEKHFTLSRDMDGPDHKASLETEELKVMVESIRNIELALGSGEKAPKNDEIKNRKVVRKSIVAKSHIKKGELFTVNNIATKRVGEGLSAALWDEVIGLKSNYDIDENDVIKL